MVKQLPFDIKTDININTCNESGFCDQEHTKCVFSNCCNTKECVRGNGVFQFPFKEEYKKAIVERYGNLKLYYNLFEDEMPENANDINNTSQGNDYTINNNGNTSHNANPISTTSVENKPKPNTNNISPINKTNNSKPNENINNQNNGNIESNKNKNTNTDNNSDINASESNQNNTNNTSTGNENADGYLIGDITSENIPMIVDGSVDKIDDNKENNNFGIITLPVIGALVVLFIGAIFSVFILKRRSMMKKNEYKEKTNKEDSSIEIVEVPFPPLPSQNYAITSVDGEDLKEPIESCEEYLNSLSRLKYKNPITINIPENQSLPVYPYYNSPTVATTESPDIETSRPISNIITAHPIMIDPQFENKTKEQNRYSHQSCVTTTALTPLTEVNSSNIYGETTNDDITPLIDVSNENNGTNNNYNNNASSICLTNTPISDVPPSIFLMYGDKKQD